MGELTIKEIADDMAFGPERCFKCGNSRHSCKCVTKPSDIEKPDEEAAQTESAETRSSESTTGTEGGSVQGTETFALAAGHTCDFEYLQNIARLGIPFTSADMDKYINLLDNAAEQNINAIINIGALAYNTLQQNGPTAQGALLRSIVADWGYDLDPDETALKLKQQPELRNDPDAIMKISLDYPAPAPSGPAFNPGFRT